MQSPNPKLYTIECNPQPSYPWRSKYLSFNDLIPLGLPLLYYCCYCCCCCNYYYYYYHDHYHYHYNYHYVYYYYFFYYYYYTTTTTSCHMYRLLRVPKPKTVKASALNPKA